MNGYGNFEVRAKNNNRGIDTQWIKDNETRISPNNSIFLKSTPQQDNFQWVRDALLVGQKQETIDNEWVRDALLVGQKQETMDSEWTIDTPEEKKEEEFEWTLDPKIEQRAAQMVEAMARGEIDTNGRPIMGQQNDMGYSFTKNMGFIKVGILGILSIVVAIGIIILGFIFS